MRQIIFKYCGFKAPMYLLAENFPHGTWFTANSEEHSGFGEFQGKKDYYVITIHGGKEGIGILSPDVIARAYNTEGGITPVYKANLSKVFSNKNVIGDLLQGGLPDGSTIQTFSFDQMVARETPKEFSRYAVVRTLDQAKKTNSCYQNIDGNLLNNGGVAIDSQVIAYLDGVDEATKFLGNVKAKFPNGKLGVWNSFNSDNYDPDVAQGVVLFLGNIGNAGLLSGNLLNDYGRFVVVSDEVANVSAEGANAHKKESLEGRISFTEGDSFTVGGFKYEMHSGIYLASPIQNNKNRCSEAISTLKDGVLRFSRLDAIFRLLVIAT
ncbi:hypothetical protein K9L97_00270 [Candidatus Woesearchaeota archaeon]|nr:hypothetical protein [Candidatus Woesearchaeota archaeon]